MDDAMIEKIARAMCEHDGLDPDQLVLENCDMVPRWRTREFKGRSHAAAAVLSEALAERDKAIAEMRKGLLEIRDDPCIEAEGNSLIAQRALEASGQWKEPTE